MKNSNLKKLSRNSQKEILGSGGGIQNATTLLNVREDHAAGKPASIIPALNYKNFR
jgi:hypothetical protein